MIIFGTRTMAKVLAIVTFICSNCHNPAAQRVIQRTTWFTLFFIPVFPVHKMRASTCTFCGATFKIDKQTAEQYEQMGASGGYQPGHPGQPGQPGPAQPAPAQPGPSQYNQPFGAQPGQGGQPGWGQPTGQQFQPQQQFPNQQNNQPPYQG